MRDAPSPRVEIDGRPPTAEQLRHPALVNYGHYTAMQVRDRKVRGLHLHLHRLQAATEEVFGATLDASRVREHIRHALGDDRPDASVRVDVFRPGADRAPSVMVSVSEPVGMPNLLQRLQSVPYQRPLPHIKHVGTFGQIYYGHVADGNGYDEALLTSRSSDPVVWEGATTNIGFFDGAAVHWPHPYVLLGITMQVLSQRLAERGVPSQQSTVRLADVGSYRAVFVTNSRGIAPVGQIDDLLLSIDAEFMRMAAEAYESVPWDPV